MILKSEKNVKTFQTTVENGKNAEERPRDLSRLNNVSLVETTRIILLKRTGTNITGE